MRRGDRGVDVRHLTQGNLCEDLGSRGVDRLEGATRPGPGALAVDQHTPVNAGYRRVRRLRHPVSLLV